MHWRILLVSIFLLIGLYFAGTGITGMVISQSCCFEPECPKDYLCDMAEPVLEQPGQVKLHVLTGAAMLGVAVFGLYALKRNHH